MLKKLGDKKMRPYNEAKKFRGGRWSAWVEGILGRNRDMLDSHRLAPYPELTFHFFGGGSGAGAGAGGEMRQRQKHVEQNGKGLGSLGTKAAQQAQGKGGGRKQPVSLCPSLSPWRGPDIQVVTSQPLQRAGRREGAALAKEKKQGRGEVITTETFGGKRAEHYDRG